MEINKIYNMDNVQGMKMLGDESIDLTLTSPPYDNLRQYKGFNFDFKNLAKELFRVTKQGGMVVWIVNDATINDSETGTSFKQALYFKEIGFNLFDTMIYVRHKGASGNNKTYWQGFEYMFVLSKGKPKTINLICDVHRESRKNHILTDRQKDGTVKRRVIQLQERYSRRTNVWYYNTGLNQSTKDKIAFEHPAIFPEQLAKDHIKTWSNVGDVVLDCFMGSGTTAKVARALGRKYIGFEISKEYCDLANKRLDETKTLFD